MRQGCLILIAASRAFEELFKEFFEHSLVYGIDNFFLFLHARLIRVGILHRRKDAGLEDLFVPIYIHELRRQLDQAYKALLEHRSVLPQQEWSFLLG